MSERTEDVNQIHSNFQDVKKPRSVAYKSIRQFMSTRQAVFYKFTCTLD